MTGSGRAALDALSLPLGDTFSPGDEGDNAAGLVVSGDEKLTFIVSWVDADGVEASLQLVNIDLAISWLVEYLESINQVEVWLVSKLDLSVLNFLFEVANLLKRMNELIFLV